MKGTEKEEIRKKSSVCAVYILIKFDKISNKRALWNKKYIKYISQ
jgi:hypothetical protein